jgi:hypothetical protein
MTCNISAYNCIEMPDYTCSALFSGDFSSTAFPAFLWLPLPIPKPEPVKCSVCTRSIPSVGLSLTHWAWSRSDQLFVSRYCQGNMSLPTSVLETQDRYQPAFLKIQQRRTCFALASFAGRYRLTFAYICL